MFNVSDITPVCSTFEGRKYKKISFDTSRSTGLPAYGIRDKASRSEWADKNKFRIAFDASELTEW